MPSSEWRERLAKAAEASGKSWREISLAAGLSQNYLGSILRQNSEPSIERMMRICDEIGVSLSSIMFGFEMEGDAERLLRVYATLNRQQKEALQALAKSMQPGEPVE